MATEKKRIVVFVHGWSVTHTDTYGELPARLASEARKQAGLELDVRNLWLGKYVSFKDEVRVQDLSRALEAALQRELGDLLRRGRRFICVTHSTGGPVVRQWWSDQIAAGRRRLPMSHLVMLAPANFGSALAQLGKSRLSRVKTWFQGVEPGTGVLDWLELGSPEAWKLNEEWLRQGADRIGGHGVYPFVLTGQMIDRKLYDNLNSYTGETGSDGVVRVSAANLNANYVLIEQSRLPGPLTRRSEWPLEVKRSEVLDAPPTAMRIIEGRSHSGRKMGILRSIKNDGKAHPTVSALLRCIQVKTAADYERLSADFAAETAQVVAQERVEKSKGISALSGRDFLHPPCTMVIFRVRDDSGNPVTDFDLLLTAGEKDNPNALPRGFFIDRQRNRRSPHVLTYYFDRDAMLQAGRLGMQLTARPDSGFVHYVKGRLAAKVEILEGFMREHQTTLVDIVLRRIVRRGAFELTRDRKHESFTRQRPGKAIDPN